MARRRRVLAASIGECVHSLGVETFAEWMEDQDLGYVCVKLGPAVPIDDFTNKIREAQPEVVALSYRPGDLHVDKMLREFADKAYRPGSALQGLVDLLPDHKRALALPPEKESFGDRLSDGLSDSYPAHAICLAELSVNEILELDV